MRHLLLVALAASVVACGGSITVIPDSTAAPGADASVEATAGGPASAEPSPAALTIAEGAAAYEAAATQYNKAIDKAYKDYGKKKTLKAQKKYLALIWKAADEFGQTLKALRFPPEVQPKIDRLLEANVIAGRAMLMASRSKSWDEFNELSGRADELDKQAGDLSGVVRDALGLELPPP